MNPFAVISVIALLACPLAAAPGLICTANDGGRTIAFAVPSPNFTLREAESIHPQLKPAFSATWRGVLKIERAGEYTFHTSLELFIDGAPVRNEPVRLAAGERQIRLEFRRANGPARAQLVWKSDFSAREPVPLRMFSHDATGADGATTAQIGLGRQLFEDFNCGACHDAQKGFVVRRGAPDLSHAGSLLNADWIYQWLDAPGRTHTLALMPAVFSSANDRADVTAFLATLTAPTNQAARLKPRGRNESGQQLFSTIGCAACHTATELALSGLAAKFNAPQLAERLRAPLIVDPSGRCPDLSLNDAEAADLAEFLTREKPAVLPSRPSGDVKRGRELVTSTGCANCHTIRENGARLKSTLHAPSLANLNPDRGCLAAAEVLVGQAPPPVIVVGQAPSPVIVQQAPPPADLRARPARLTTAEGGRPTNAPAAQPPRYTLSPTHRDALRAFVRSPDVSEAPVQDFARMTAQFRCTACHEITQPAALELSGNQAPPVLTDAGNKLRRSWLQRVLLEKKRIRTWTAIRMPHFGPAVSRLIDSFAGQCGAEPGEGAAMAAPSFEEIQRGVRLLGKNDGGLGCVACHDFRGARASGDLHGPDMIEMNERLRADWTARWLREPGRVTPGTAMPAFFTEAPRAEAEMKIALIVRTLAAGRDLPMPEGIESSAAPYIVRVGAEPVVFRGFIGDTPRAIAIGLPGMISCAFDADACRLRYAWAGDFLDTKAVWANRGGLPANIVGRRFFTATNGAALRVGDGPPRQARFRGYRLHNKFPELRYELNGVPVTDSFTSRAEPPALVRTVRVADTTEPVWFEANGSSHITVNGRDLAVVPGWNRISARGPVEFTATMPVNADNKP